MNLNKLQSPERRILFTLLACVLTGNLFAQLPVVSSGSIIRIEKFKSNFVDTRTIDVWLPDGYNAEKKYNVVYMHDGQMLFDSTTTWNKQEWKVDEVFSQLIKNNTIEKCIVVGIWNNGKYRHSEYFPQKYLNTVSEDFKKEYISTYLQGKPQSDNYLKFIVEELKPYIDKNFSTHPDKNYTFIMGSSMGGMISMYAVSEYPNVFFGAGCLSIAWVGMNKPNFELPLAAFNYLQKNVPSASGHKIYMDHGTTEMDTLYAVYQDFVDIIMEEKGYTKDTYSTKIFKGKGHNETDWSKRLTIPLEFLMPKQPDQKPLAGKIDTYENFQSIYITKRKVEVWLPENYDAAKKYAVLYMHDGQMVNDPNIARNISCWNVDDIVTKLIQQNEIKDAIVVGVWSGGETSLSHSSSQQHFESLSTEQKELVYAAAKANSIADFDGYAENSYHYLRFLVTELKPFIDAKYATYPERNNTFVAGSGMGGLISLYAICQYPNIFGGAACLSSPWPSIFSVEGNPLPDAFLKYMSAHIPNPKTHKIYFDYGDQTPGTMYPPLQKKVDEVMKAKGYSKKNWMTQFFPKDDQSEKAWNTRLDTPLLFLLPK